MDFPESTVPLAPPHLASMTVEEFYRMPVLGRIPNVQFDIKRLQEEVEYIANNYEPVYPDFGGQQNKYGGWSLTTSSGQWNEGFEAVKGFKNGVWDKEKAQQQGLRSKHGRFSYTIKTELYKGYLAEVVDTFVNMGFYPCGVRILDIPPGGFHIGKHTDGPPNVYSVRLHVPIITNDDSYHVWYTDSEIREHMIADGSAWLFKTNLMHDAYNNSPDKPRRHLVMDAWDTKHIVPGFEANLKFTELFMKLLKMDNPNPDNSCILKDWIN